MTTGPKKAGWYVDPREVNTLRYFDGETWTEQVAPMQNGLRLDFGHTMRIVALGVLVAVALLYVLGNVINA
jgi:hypothetical protein